MIGLFRAVRISAAAEVMSEEPGSDFNVRRILRAYSQKFHTPLHIVETLPLAGILRHYYEDYYAGLADGDPNDLARLREEIDFLAVPEEERKKKLAEQEEEDREFHRAAAEEAARQGLIDVLSPPPPETDAPVVNMDFSDLD